MSNNIGFVISRSAELKVYAPLASAALAKGYKVFLICGPNPEQSWPNTPTYKPIKANLRFQDDQHIQYIPYSDYKDAHHQIITHRIKNIFTLGFRPGSLTYYLGHQISQKFRLYGLQSYADYLATPPELMQKFDAFFTFSPIMKDIYQKVYPKASMASLNSVFQAVGNPMTENINTLQQHSADIRSKYSLPSNKKIVLLLSFNIGNELWRKYVFGSPNWLYSLAALIYFHEYSKIPLIWSQPKLKRILAELKQWTRQNNAILVTKTRSKQNEPSYLKRTTDYLITDTGSWLPYPALELMSISDLVVSFNSTGIIESSALGKFMLSIKLTDDKTTSIGDTFTRTIYRPSNVSQTVDYYDFQKFLSSHALSDFTKQSSEFALYNNTFISKNTTPASHQILDYLNQH